MSHQGKPFTGVEPSSSGAYEAAARTLVLYLLRRHQSPSARLPHISQTFNHPITAFKAAPSPATLHSLLMAVFARWEGNQPHERDLHLLGD